MFPLQTIQDIFKNKHSFEQVFREQSEKALAEESGFYKLAHATKGLSKTEIQRVQVYRSSDFFKDYFSRLIKETAHHIDETVLNKASEIEKERYLKEVRERIDSIRGDIHKLGKVYPKISAEEKIKHKAFKSAWRVVKIRRKTQSNSPFALDNIDADGKFMKKLMQSKPDEALLRFFSPQEILAGTLSSCYVELFELKIVLFKKYQDSFLKIFKLKSITGTIQTTFHWIGEPKQLELLWKYIQKEKLINPISLEDFKIIFGNEQVEKIKNRIEWIDLPKVGGERTSNLRSLFAFLYFLKKERKLPIEDLLTPKSDNNLYVKVNKCFADMKGKDFRHINKGNVSFRNLTPDELKKYEFPKNIAKIKNSIPNF